MDDTKALANHIRINLQDLRSGRDKVQLRIRAGKNEAILASALDDLENVITSFEATIIMLESQEQQRQNNWDRLVIDGVIIVGGATDENTPESANARLDAQGLKTRAL